MPSVVPGVRPWVEARMTAAAAAYARFVRGDQTPAAGAAPSAASPATALAGRANALAAGDPVDLQLFATAEAARGRAQARLDALPPAPSGGASWQHHVPRLVQAAAMALFLGQLSQEGWLGRTTLLSMGGYVPTWVPGAQVDDLALAVRRAEAEQVVFAQHQLCRVFNRASDALGPMPRPVAAKARRGGAGPGRADAEAAVDALAARVDARRRRLHHVEASLRCRAAEAAAAAADPRLVAHATAQRRGLQVAAIAVLLSFAFGYYAQFASLVGLGTVAVALLVAVGLLGYNLHAALNYVAGKASGADFDRERDRERNRALAALAQARLEAMAGLWSAQRDDELRLAELRQQLATLAD